MESLHCHALHPMTAQSRHSVLAPHLQILGTSIESQGDRELLAVGQPSTWRGLYGDDLKENLSRLQRSASLEEWCVHPVDRIPDRAGLEWRTLQPMNHLMYELLIDLLLGEPVPFSKRGVVNHDEHPLLSGS